MPQLHTPLCPPCAYSTCPPHPCCAQVRLYEHLGPATSLDDEQEVNDTLGQLLMVMQTLDEEIGAPCMWGCMWRRLVSEAAEAAGHASPAALRAARQGAHGCNNRHPAPPPHMPAPHARPAAGPMIEADGQHFNRRWGYLSRAGVNDKSQLMRQIEKYAGEWQCGGAGRQAGRQRGRGAVWGAPALPSRVSLPKQPTHTHLPTADIFTSRVSNFLRYTPFEYFRSPAQLLVHDRPTADRLVLSSGALTSADLPDAPSNGHAGDGSAHAGANGHGTSGGSAGAQSGSPKKVRPAY